MSDVRSRVQVNTSISAFISVSHHVYKITYMTGCHEHARNNRCWSRPEIVPLKQATCRRW